MVDAISEQVEASKKRRAVLVEQKERLRQDAMEAARVMSTAYIEALNSGVALVWKHQQHVEAEARALQQSSRHHASECKKWRGAVSTLRADFQSLAARGGIEAWARGIQSDMALINASVEYLYSPDVRGKLQARGGGAVPRPRLCPEGARSTCVVHTPRSERRGS
mmetsp:Transcript_7884/g.17270  ORF Transcript_7884/g.17270 Transcript_7884/m.17270 type:complete len:165 (+) Transcript_7884:252-746(+)